MDLPQDLLPDQTYSICDETWFLSGDTRRIVSTNLVRQRQKVVVKKDCTGTKDEILRKRRYQFGRRGSDEGRLLW